MKAPNYGEVSVNSSRLVVTSNYYVYLLELVGSIVIV